MNYPLAEAILGFAGGSRLDMDVVRGHHEYRGEHLAARRVGLRPGGSIDLLAAYAPEVDRGPAQPPRARTTRRGSGPSSATTSTGVRLATLIQMTLPGAPCIYYGDEIGLAGGNDPDCRRAFPWDERSWDHDLRTFVRDLVHVRASEPALRAGQVNVVAAAGGAVAYERRLDDTRMVVVVNAGDDATRLELRLDAADGRRPVPLDLAGGFGEVGGAPVVSGGIAPIEVGARSGAILRLT